MIIYYYLMSYKYLNYNNIQTYVIIDYKKIKISFIADHTDEDNYGIFLFSELLGIHQMDNIYKYEEIITYRDRT